MLGLKPKPEFLPLFNLGEPVNRETRSELLRGLSRVELGLKHGAAVVVASNRDITSLATNLFRTGRPCKQL